jgi:hypothetical protein
LSKPILTIDASASANDDTTAESPSPNPLWAIVAGMACFFAVALAVISQDAQATEMRPDVMTTHSPANHLLP